MKFRLVIDIEPAADPELSVSATLAYLADGLRSNAPIARFGVGTHLPIKDRRGDPIGYFVFEEKALPVAQLDRTTFHHPV